jgi:hypothetical protein
MPLGEVKVEEVKIRALWIRWVLANGTEKQGL